LRLPIYIERIRAGWLRPTATKIEVVTDRAATALLDGHHSAGQIVAVQAMEMAIDKAGEHGIGAVAVRNSNHFGIAAYYAQMVCERDMIGIVMSNTAPLMPPIGGAEKVLGNNPLAIAAPTDGEFPIVLDMAMSNVAIGKIIHAKTSGTSIPLGWGADRNGQATTDPQAVLDGGFILPVGGPKGFGLALMIEMFCGVLSGGAFAKTIPSLYDITQQQAIGHFMIAVQISSFMEIEQFKRMVGVLTQYVKGASKAEGVDELYLPGELEFRWEQKRRTGKLAIDDNLLIELRKLGQSLDVVLPL
jgi:LDH2 family malate/lactate/ureidoglycolate dehydrogenase